MTSSRSRAVGCSCGADNIPGSIHTPDCDDSDAVYVDDAFVDGDWGKWTGGGHLQADTAEALHAFAAKLGLRREWFQQRSGRPERDHYDVTRSKRDQAILLGAIPESTEDGTRRRKAFR
jgi:Protein of unknown function (DUF4031)